MKKEYTTYTAIDFAQEDSFIRWIKEGDPVAQRFWEDWLQQHPEKQSTIEEARRLIKSIRVKEREPSPKKIRQLWNQIDEATAADTEIKDKAVVTSRPIRRLSIVRWVGYASAAACLAALIIFFSSNPTTTVITNSGEQTIVYLPDSSKVWLNAVSSLAYLAKDWSEERILKLEGEAFFEVKKGSSFTVQTNLGTVRVLGTSFNVFARNQQFAVQCATGKVEVKTKQGTGKILMAGQQTDLQANGTLKAVIPTEKTNWREGQFYFKNASFERVVETLERQFAIEIEATKSALEKTGTFYFETNNLDSALYRVIWPLGLEYKRNGQQVQIE